KHGAKFGVLDPNVAVVLIDNHAHDGQPQATAGSVTAAGIGRILLEDVLQVFCGNGISGIANIDPVGGRLGTVPNAPFGRRWNGAGGLAAIPKIGISAQFDGSASRSEFAGVVQNVDQDLLNLPWFEE